MHPSPAMLLPFNQCAQACAAKSVALPNEKSWRTQPLTHIKHYKADASRVHHQRRVFHSSVNRHTYNRQKRTNATPSIHKTLQRGTKRKPGPSSKEGTGWVSKPTVFQPSPLVLAESHQSCTCNPSYPSQSTCMAILSVKEETDNNDERRAQPSHYPLVPRKDRPNSQPAIPSAHGCKSSSRQTNRQHHRNVSSKMIEGPGIAHMCRCSRMAGTPSGFIGRMQTTPPVVITSQISRLVL